MSAAQQQNDILIQHASFKLETDEDATALYNFLKTHWRQSVLIGDPLVVTVCTASEKRTPEQNKRYQKGLRDRGFSLGRRRTTSAGVVERQVQGNVP